MQVEQITPAQIRLLDAFKGMVRDENWFPNTAQAKEMEVFFEGEWLVPEESHLSAPIHYLDAVGVVYKNTVCPARCRRWKYKMGDVVKKKSGSDWEGTIVGFYSTSQTPCGYAIESKYHKHTVQIFPEAALVKVEQTQ